MYFKHWKWNLLQFVIFKVNKVKSPFTGTWFVVISRMHPFCFLDNSVDVFCFPDVVSTSHSFEVPSYFHSTTKKGSTIKLLIPGKSQPGVDIFFLLLFQKYCKFSFIFPQHILIHLDGNEIIFFKESTFGEFLMGRI